ncbi:hypothetical protein AAFF_G00362240 [Aldrovandia affinis]|uniref:Uncharacterized protein n=1 Tax=Aldrovandia affinis TaxID=143900 RepID=A0AAD7SID3_9TELE|nr:hypothetical protein AAFF_G00362240 [Aldrovandia affinis]
MAEAADCIGDSSVDSTTTMATPILEEFTEEEDVFLPESNPTGLCHKTEKSAKNVSAIVQVRKEGVTATENQMEKEFLLLNIRKQVSYR